MEVLSEHMCQGWLEGHLLTAARILSCYEAFIHIIDSMFTSTRSGSRPRAIFPWRRPIASLNYLLTSHVCGRITMASATRTRAFWITWSTRRRTSCGLAQSARPRPRADACVRAGARTAAQVTSRVTAL